MELVNINSTYDEIIVFLLVAIIGIVLAYILSRAADDAYLHKVRENLSSLTDEDFDAFDSKSCENIAFQIENYTFADTEFGNLSRECAIFILKGLAENMNDNENLSEYFFRKNNET